MCPATFSSMNQFLIHVGDKCGIEWCSYMGAASRIWLMGLVSLILVNNQKIRPKQGSRKSWFFEVTDPLHKILTFFFELASMLVKLSETFFLWVTPDYRTTLVFSHWSVFSRNGSLNFRFWHFQVSWCFRPCADFQQRVMWPPHPNKYYVYYFRKVR